MLILEIVVVLALFLLNCFFAMADGSVPFPDVMQLIGASEAPSGDYVTLAGFILAQVRELPRPGNHVAWAGWRFEVVDMDGRRIDMVLTQRQGEH